MYYVLMCYYPSTCSGGITREFRSKMEDSMAVLQYWASYEPLAGVAEMSGLRIDEVSSFVLTFGFFKF